MVVPPEERELLLRGKAMKPSKSGRSRNTMENIEKILVRESVNSSYFVVQVASDEEMRTVVPTMLGGPHHRYLRANSRGSHCMRSRGRDSLGISSQRGLEGLTMYCGVDFLQISFWRIYHYWAKSYVRQAPCSRDNITLTQ